MTDKQDINKQDEESPYKSILVRYQDLVDKNKELKRERDYYKSLFKLDFEATSVFIPD